MLTFLVAFSSYDVSFTMFKESKSNVIWLHRKIQHQDGESPIPKQNWASYKCLVRKSEKMCLS